MSSMSSSSSLFPDSASSTFFFRHLHCCRCRHRNFSKARRLSISHGNLNYWTWCSGNSWSSRSGLPLHYRCRLNRTCLLVSIHASLSSPDRLCLQKMKRHDSRTPSSELIKYSFHQKMKWNEMNCTVSNYKWNEMKHQKKILIINLTVSSKLDIWKTDIFTRNLISSKPYPICGKLKIMWSKHIFF